MTHYYPASLALEDRRCVVLGGGPLAAEKMQGLLRAGARVTVIAAQAEPEIWRAAVGGRIALVERDYLSGDLQGAWLVIDARGRGDINAACPREAEDRRVLPHLADRPQPPRRTRPP